MSSNAEEAAAEADEDGEIHEDHRREEALVGEDESPPIDVNFDEDEAGAEAEGEDDRDDEADSDKGDCGGAKDGSEVGVEETDSLPCESLMPG